VPPLGAFAIAVTVIFLVGVVVVTAYQKGKAAAREAAAVPVPERDAASRRAYMDAVQDAHDRYMRSIAKNAPLDGGAVAHANPLAATAGAINKV